MDSCGFLGEWSGFLANLTILIAAVAATAKWLSIKVRADSIALAKQLAERDVVMAKGFEHVDARFEKIDARFEKIDARFEKIDTRFEKINARFDEMRKEHIESIREVHNRIDQCNARIDATLQRVDQTYQILLEEVRRDRRA